MTGDINQAIQQLIDVAKQIGTPAFGLIARSMYNHAVANAILVVLVFLLASVGGKYLPKAIAYSIEEDKPEIGIPAIVATLALAVAVLGALVSIGDIVPTLMCPECEAARSILSR